MFNSSIPVCCFPSLLSPLFLISSCQERGEWQATPRTEIIEMGCLHRISFISLSIWWKGLPGGSGSKVSACRVRDPGLIPGLGRSTGEGKWQPTLVLLPGKFHGQRSLVGYRPQGCKESDVTEQLHFTSLSFKRQASFNFMAAVTICSDFGAQENKLCHCFHCFPTDMPCSDGTGCHDLSFLNVEF